MYEQCPLLHQNKPSRELNFCDAMGRWWIKWAVFVLKILLKSGQNGLASRWEVELVGRHVDEWASG